MNRALNVLGPVGAWWQPKLGGKNPMYKLFGFDKAQTQAAPADDWFAQQGPPIAADPPPMPGYGSDVAAGYDPGYAARMADPGYRNRLGLDGALEMDPGYQFRLQQGQQAIERSAAAKGTLLTGGTAKGLERYAQNYASGEFQNRYARQLGEEQMRYGRLLGEQQNRYNQLFGLAQLGQQSAAGQAGQNQGYANATGELYTQQGNALAAGTVGAANAWQQPIQQGANAAQMYYLSRLYGTQPPGGGAYANQVNALGAITPAQSAAGTASLGWTLPAGSSGTNAGWMSPWIKPAGS